MSKREIYYSDNTGEQIAEGQLVMLDGIDINGAVRLFRQLNDGVLHFDGPADLVRWLNDKLLPGVEHKVPKKEEVEV